MKVMEIDQDVYIVTFFLCFNKDHLGVSDHYPFQDTGNTINDDQVLA